MGEVHSKYRITVLMPVYNCEDTLTEAIESLLSQTFDKFKIIICNDGSIDNTLSIALDYASRYENIECIHNASNLGRSASSNRCLKFVDTEYVARMDGDDISLPERFMSEIEFLDANKQYVLVSSPMIYFDKKGVYRIGTAIQEPTYEDFRNESVFCHGPSMIRTDALKSVGGYTESSEVERIEDFDLWYKLYINGFKGYNLQRPLYKMRNGKAAFARRKASDRWRAFLNGWKIRKSLGLSYPLLTSLYYLPKALIPWWLAYVFRRYL